GRCGATRTRSRLSRAHLEASGIGVGLRQAPAGGSGDRHEARQVIGKHEDAHTRLAGRGSNHGAHSYSLPQDLAGTGPYRPVAPAWTRAIAPGGSPPPPLWRRARATARAFPT